MPTRREVPRNFEPSPDDELSDTGPSFVYIGHGSCRPENEWQALMEAPPFIEPEVSQFERLALRDVIVDALESLTSEEQWIFDALYVRKLSERQLAAEIKLPKTTMRRRKEKLLLRLRHILEDDVRIVEYLKGAQG